MGTKPNTLFGIELERLIETRGITKAGMARMIGVSQKHIGNLVRGDIDVTPNAFPQNNLSWSSGSPIRACVFAIASLVRPPADDGNFRSQQ